MSVTYKAILIGNSVFPEDPEKLLKLNGPPNDVKILKQALCDSEKGLFEEKNVTTLLDKTSAEITKAVEVFFKSLANNDQSLFYYSGHGVLDLQSRLYLCANDSKKDSLDSSTIDSDLLNRILYKSRTNKHVIILDCCHSGGFERGLTGAILNEGFVITSSSSGELTGDAENPNSPSPFTKQLSEALLTDDIDTNYVNVIDILSYILKEFYDETKFKPQFKLHGDDFPLLCKRKFVPQDELEKIKAEKKPPNLGIGKPRLGVSEQNINYPNVGSDENLQDDIILVFNEGSGELDWMATCTSDWIEVECHDKYAKLKFTPKTGMNRGKIYVKDKNGGGSKTIRVTVEKLKEPSPIILPETEITKSTNTEKPEKNPIKAFSITPAKLLASFQDVKMRHVNQAKTIDDNSEQSGSIKVFSDRIEFVGELKTVIKNIDILNYYPHNINPGFMYNYMGISGSYDGVKQLMYFYSFSWFGEGQTWKMTEQIHDLIKNKKLTVDANFKTHINNNQTNQSTSSNYQPPQKPTPPPQQNNIYMPGRWNIYIYQFGQQVSYLNLYFNVGGALNGTQQSAEGFSQISGTWGYNVYNRLLTYNVMVSLMNGVVPEQGSVTLQMGQNGNITGADFLGRQWTLQKTGN